MSATQELGTEQTVSSAPLSLPPLGADLITPPASGSSRQLLEPVAETIAADRNDHFRVETVLFDRASDQSSPHLSWPQPVQIFQLWQAYIDNVNPMTNILHVQTMQRMVLQATSCKPEELPKPSRALLSSVFLAAIESLSDEACLNLMMLPKDECVRKLFSMTKECLADANFLEVATTEALQALVLYLMAARQHSTPQSLWMVIGVAVRLAHRLGIHREKSLQGMTVFAAEMNRRLWWQLHLLNRHYVNLCEDIDSSDPAHILIFDTKRPLNLNEADLHPDMTTLPPEREGVTDMVFCSIRYEIGSFVRDLSLTAESQSRIEAIQHLEARLEE
ncbi:hypothetical protein KCU73_g10272, partial [Aureobasidium melanogenum]